MQSQKWRVEAQGRVAKLRMSTATIARKMSIKKVSILGILQRFLSRFKENGMVLPCPS